MPELERPTVEYIKKREHREVERWQATHAMWEMMDTFYNQENEIWDERLRKSRPTSHTPRATDVIDHAADTQMPYEPRAHRDPVGRGKENKDAADRLEPALTAVMNDAAARELQLTFKQAGRSMLLYGYTVLNAPVLVLNDKPKKPVKKDGETKEEFEQREVVYENERTGFNPVRLRCPHPARVLMPPGEKSPPYAIVHQQFYPEELQALSIAKVKTRKYAQVYEPTKEELEGDALIKVTEYWNGLYHAVKKTDGDMLWIEKNTWGFIPFLQAFAGFGGEITSDEKQDPKYLCKGLLNPILDPLKREHQMVSAKHEVVISGAFPYLVLEPGVDAAAIIAKIAAGQPLDETELKRLGWFARPDLPPQLFQAANDVEREIQEGSYTLQMGGYRQEGVSAVGTTAILSTAANRKFAGPAKQLNYLASICASNILRLVDNVSELDGAITVGGHTLSKQDIAGNYNAKVTFELVDPVLQLQIRQQGAADVAAGRRSLETFWSADARLEDASGERKRLIEDKAWEHPAIVEVMVNAFLEGKGLLSMAEALTELRAKRAAGNGAGVDLPLTDGGVRTSNPAEPGSQEAAQAALNTLRQPLAPDVAKPGQVPPVARP